VFGLIHKASHKEMPLDASQEGFRLDLPARKVAKEKKEFEETGEVLKVTHTLIERTTATLGLRVGRDG
jgi:hypothetical protein